MGIGTILVGVALFIVICVLVITPLLEARRPAVEAPPKKQLLEEEHQANIRAIRELDLDFRTHKLLEDDYRNLRAAQVQRGAQVLRELDALAEADEIDQEIESQIASLSASSPTCPECHSPVHSDDRFCAHCGYRFPAPAIASQPRDSKR
jgi:hypothetical protein